MATQPNPLRTFATGPLNGVGLATYFVLLPYVVLTRWRMTPQQPHGDVIRALLVGLSIFWVLFLVQFVNNVVRLRRGQLVGANGSAWLAGIAFTALPFLATGAALSMLDHPASAPVVAAMTPHRAAFEPLVVGATTRHDRRGADPGPPDPTALSALSLALVAKRQRDQLLQSDGDVDDEGVDLAILQLRHRNPGLLVQLLARVGERLDGVVTLAGSFNYAAVPGNDDGVVAVMVRSTAHQELVSFAREGGRLRVPANWTATSVRDHAVLLNEQGRMEFATSEDELIRALAVRSLRRAVVVFLGDASRLDDTLRACSVTLHPVSPDGLVEIERGEEQARVVGDAPAVAESLDPDQIHVEVLRADPMIVGLCEPFTTTLRRRCVEMVAYLALHHHEPVTGDRLRSRVLSHADVDASMRTLANTASAVRRSLGVDERGPRLHPVSSSGLYVTHSLTSDVEHFHSLVARARCLPLEQGASLARRALALVKGEPLASVLRGFEWFLVEGFSARLQRDAEWASLALHHQALLAHDYELAYWSLSQGRLIDPFSDALAEALVRVPRLRQFGGDGPGVAQHEPVGTGGAVGVGRPSGRLVREILP